jgi:hydrogenase maturation protease
MGQILVIGCGNRYATDDGVGLAVARALQGVPLPEGVIVIEAGCPGLNLLDLWGKTDQVLIIDAVKSGSVPGTIHTFGLEALPSRESLPDSLHGVNLVDALTLGQLMDQLPARLKVVGVEILSEEPFYEGLTPLVEAAVPEACLVLQEEIQTLLAGSCG